MITPDFQQAELLDIWQDMLDLHRDLTIGHEVTHPEREKLARLTKDVFKVRAELDRCKIFVPEKIKLKINNRNPTGDNNA